LTLFTRRSGHDLFLNTNAPRMMQPLTGDFTIRTKIAITADFDYQGGGLLVWQDSDNYIRLELGGSPRAITMPYRLQGYYTHPHSGAYGYTSAYLKITREGEVFQSYYSLDGLVWRAAGTLIYPASETVMVGTHLINEWQGNPISAFFDYFEINGCPVTAGGTSEKRTEAKVYPPVTAPKAAFPVKWTVKGGATTSETYLAWDTSSHEFRNDYANRTATQSGGMDAFTAIMEAPTGAEAIYFKPYAVVDGTPVWGPQEYVVPVTYALNVGAARWGLDAARQYWNPDRESDFSPVWYEFWGGDDKLVVERPIANTDEDWIYQSQRQGMSRFSAWLGPNVYEMTLQVGLHLAELEGKAPGQRVFDIYLERGTPNEVVLRNVDVAALAGQDAATVLTATVTVNSIPEVDEHLNIEFVGQGESVPILNGLVLRGVSAVPQFLVTRTPGSGADDTYTDPSGAKTTAAKVLLGGNAQYHGGLRFPALQIPQSAVARYAWLDVTAADDAYMTTTLKIHAHAHDSSPSFESQAVVPNRPRTTAFSAWDIPGTPWRLDRGYRSPDLREVVQEVLSRAGWRQGNALGLLLIGQPGDPGPRSIWSFEGKPGSRAQLSVWYSRGSDVPPPTATPTITPTPTATATPRPGSRALLPLIVRN
jgi:regulation of enolase protein 1 (concanavalin A-like superfamily)